MLFRSYQRPDILEYMETAYKDLDLQLLPERIFQELNQKIDLANQIQNFSESFSTEILSKGSLLDSDFWIQVFVDNFSK